MLPKNLKNSEIQILSDQKDGPGVGMTAEFTEHFSGPLPHPSIMEHYERIVPGSANRIIVKFESQTEHRQKMESRFISAEVFRSVGGLVGGFIIAMTAMIGGIIPR